MESICPICKKPYDGVVCTQCTVTDLDVSGLMASEGLHVASQEQEEDDGATAFLVDLVSNRKIPITTPRCKVGRDDLNDIVISGDQSISRFHFVISKENNQYLVQDGKSRHGTFLNGNQITAPEPIHDGDVLKVGVSLFWFVIENVSVNFEAGKASPLDMESNETELEFGAPEPTSTRFVSASPQTNFPGADLSETGAFPALELPAAVAKVSVTTTSVESGKMQESNALESLLESRGTEAATTIEELLPDVSGQASAEVPDQASAEATGEVPGGASAEAITEETGEASAEVVAEAPVETGSLSHESDISHSYRDVHDHSRAVNAMTGDSAARDFSNFSFFEPSTEVASELSSDSLVLKDELPAAAASLQPTEGAVEPGAGTPVRGDAKDEDVAQPLLAAEAPEPAQAAQVSQVSQSAPASQAFRAFQEAEPFAESLGSSTLEPSESSSLEVVINNFGNLFEAEPPSKLVSPVNAGGEEEPPLSVEASSGSHSVEEVQPEAKTNNVPSSAATLDKLAEAVDEARSPATPASAREDPVFAELISQAHVNQLSEPAAIREPENGAGEEQSLTSDKPSSNGAKSLMSTTKESLSATVPDWCNRYFHGELTRLSRELSDLNDQVRYAQQKIKEVEGRVALTKGIRNTLLTATGEELVEGCGRVLSLLGWKTKISEDDKTELRIETDEKHTCIARVVWTETQADRTHLGQLSISQTRYWCEQGIEPKGILIVSRAGANGPQALTSSDLNSELADYASKKNVCLMTTLQLLAIFKDIALHDGSMDTARATIMASNGWLAGFNLEPGDIDKEESSSNKLSSLLSA